MLRKWQIKLPKGGETSEYMPCNSTKKILLYFWDSVRMKMIGFKLFVPMISAFNSGAKRKIELYLDSEKIDLNFKNALWNVYPGRINPQHSYGFGSWNY